MVSVRQHEPEIGMDRSTNRIQGPGLSRSSARKDSTGLREPDLVENIIVQIRQLISIYVIFVLAASNLQSCSGDKVQQTRSCHSVLRLRESTHEREVFLPILRIMHR